MDGAGSPKQSEMQENYGEWSAFVDRLVHDLREPLRSINVFAELLEESAKEKLGAEDAQYVTEIRGGASRMQVLLEGLAAYSMSMHEPSAAAATSLQSALKIVLANMGAKIREEGATVTAGDLPRVALSLDRAMQVFEHLIGNSLRFRSQEAPAIRISAVESENGYWAISVQDNGLGIPAEFHEAVFRPFVRVEGKKYQGAGMGLAICRKIVEAHGGAMRMESPPDRGVICTFTLPAA